MSHALTPYSHALVMRSLYEASLGKEYSIGTSNLGCKVSPLKNKGSGRVITSAFRCWCISRRQHRRHKSWSFIETARPNLLE